MHAVYRLNHPRGSTQDARNSAGCGLDRIEHILRNDFTTTTYPPHLHSNYKHDSCITTYIFYTPYTLT
jgi:hypothetical protein